MLEGFYTKTLNETHQQRTSVLVVITPHQFVEYHDGVYLH